ncbi:MAG TPA: glycosyl hydrolase family 18 protein, partial [Candidatus Limnocylindria bacterium]|nr:glycosyl hydrolase family 18 protein [Candidatus Limnocylindria bacterium]
MLRRARLLIAVALVLLLPLTWLPPTASLAADPLPDGAVRTAGGRVLPPLPDELGEPSVHAEMLAAHAQDAPSFTAGGAPSVLLEEAGEPAMAGASVDPLGTLSEGAQVSAAGLPNGLRKEVFGFLPYWMLTDSALASLNYQLVSTIAYFSVNANKDGDLVKGTSGSPSTGWAGWTSSRMTDVINRAHANGVKVVLTVTMMAWDSASANRQALLLGSSTARSRLVNQIVNAVRNRNADGVNLDFEPLASSLRDEYVSFVKQLKRALVNNEVGDFLTVCVMASAATWATGYDVAGLTASGAADALFVMGYDFHWSGSSRAGGVAPIQSPYTIDVAGTMADFLTETSGSKLIWGVPYYGRTWPTSSKALNAKTLGGGSKSYTYNGHLAQAAQFGRRWDDVGKVPWYRYWDNAGDHWVQGYYDDVTSLGVKYDLVNARGLRGTGMWTLLMDQGRNELWRLLARKFVKDTAPPSGGITLLPRTTDAQALKVRWRAEDFASGVSHYRLQWRTVGGAWHDWRRSTTKRSAWFAGEARTSYEFRVKAVDFKGNAQPWTTAPATPATLRPDAFARVASASLNVRSGPGTGYGVIATATGGDVVYVLEGPVAAGGYDWYRVQYGFGEWPSADLPLIAWMAGRTSDSDLMVPTRAPSTTRLAPFVAQQPSALVFSPNGDGVQDDATVGFSVKGPASAIRVDVLDAAGNVVRSFSDGPRPTGSTTVSWDGRLDGGSWAPAGRYLLRIRATDADGALHYAPAASFSSAALARWGVTADRQAPAVDGDPAAGDQMVPAAQRVVLTFSEPMQGLNAAELRLYAAGSQLAANVRARDDRLRAVLIPQQPMPTDVPIELRLGSGLRDRAGNQPATDGWTFTTAPGVPYAPARPGRLEAGRRTGYAIAQNGDLLAADAVTLATGRATQITQRATVPNLPGSWLYAETGPLAGHWLRESAGQHVKGETLRRVYARAQRITMRAEKQVGYRFDSQGAVTASRTLRLGAASAADSTTR